MNKPIGYELHVTSWENDGDMNATEILFGLTKEDTKFWIEFLKRFESKHNGGDIGKEYNFGNDANDMEVVSQHTKDILDKHPNISIALKEDLLKGVSDSDYLYETINELFGLYPKEEYYASEYEYFFRVVDSIKVFYIPVAIIDVTAEFI